MNRIYNLRKEDFFDIKGITYMNITSVEGGKVFYNDKAVQELILDVKKIKGLYVQVTGPHSSTVTIRYTLSYDGINYNKSESTLKIKFKEKEINTPDSTEALLEKVLPSQDIDVYSTFVALYSKNIITDCPTVILPLVERSIDAGRNSILEEHLSLKYKGSANIVHKVGDEYIKYKGEKIDVNEDNELYFIIPIQKYNPKEAVQYVIGTDTYTKEIEDITPTNYCEVWTDFYRTQVHGN